MDKATDIIPINESDRPESEQRKQIFSVMNKITVVSSENLLSRYDKYRVTKEKDIPSAQPTVTIAGGAIASPGNITGISAAAKAGKTAITGVITAGAISKTGDIDGFPELFVQPNPDGKAVISFDTEQSEADQQHNVNAILRRAGFEKTPDYYRAYNIRQLNTDEYQKTTNEICDLCAGMFNGIHLIIIDGGADYILSVNDEEAASRIVQYFTHLSIKHDCPVIVVVHQNPGSDKERGHFGSEIQRKCYGLLTITKQGDISTLAPKIMRKAGHGDIPLIHFTYSKDKGYHVPVEAENPDTKRDQKVRDQHASIAEQVFRPPIALKYADAVSAIMKATSKGDRTAKTMISNMLGWGYIKKGNDGNYRKDTG